MFSIIVTGVPKYTPRPRRQRRSQSLLYQLSLLVCYRLLPKLKANSQVDQCALSRRILCSNLVCLDCVLVLSWQYIAISARCLGRTTVCCNLVNLVANPKLAAAALFAAPWLRISAAGAAAFHGDTGRSFQALENTKRSCFCLAQPMINIYSLRQRTKWDFTLC